MPRAQRRVKKASKPRQAISKIPTDLDKPERVGFDLTRELWEIAELEAKQLKREGRDMIRASEVDCTYSCLGELLIQDVLYELEVPSIRNPVFLHSDFVSQIRPWKVRQDFDIAEFGTVDVKTTPPDTRKENKTTQRKWTLINQDGWRRLPADRIFSLKIESCEKAWLYGSILGSAIRNQTPWCKTHKGLVSKCSMDTCSGTLCWQVPLDNLIEKQGSAGFQPGTFLIKKLASLSRNPQIQNIKVLGES